MTLSGAGLLAGTPTRSGTFVVSYQTRGTAPATTGHTGTVLVKVTAASVSLSAGGQDTCLTRSDGTARCWGRNNYGQIGDGTLLGRDVPTKVLGTGWANISTSGSTTCAVKADGTLWCWGLDNFGQVGVGHGAPVRKPHQVGDRARLGRDLGRLQPHLRDQDQRHPVVLGREPPRSAGDRHHRPPPRHAAAGRHPHRLGVGHHRRLALVRTDDGRRGVLLG